MASVTETLPVLWSEGRAPLAKGLDVVSHPCRETMAGLADWVSREDEGSPTAVPGAIATHGHGTTVLFTLALMRSAATTRHEIGTGGLGARTKRSHAANSTFDRGNGRV